MLFGWNGTSFSHIAKFTTVPLALTARQASLTLAGYARCVKRTMWASCVGDLLRALDNIFPARIKNVCGAKLLCEVLALRGATSATMIVLAPRALRHWITPSPIGPAPITRAESPGLR